MLIIPKQRSSNIDDIQEYKELDRRIIIYNTSVDLTPTKENRFSLMNVSVQNGNVGGIQSNTERLYTVNMYYGTIDLPLFYNPENFQPSINYDAVVRIYDYAFAHKLVDTFKDTSETTNNWLWCTGKKQLVYKSRSSHQEENEIVASDPRFYNLDHQLLVADDNGAFFTDFGLEIGMDQIARMNDGVGYRLNELIDHHTHIYVSKINIEDPYKLIKKNKKLMYFVNDILCKIQNVALLAMVKSYTIILDKELGYNILNAKRIFKTMEKQYEVFEIANFFECVKNSYEELKEKGFDVRITIVFNDAQTNVSVLPIQNEKEKITTEIADVQMYEYVEETISNDGISRE